jgi:hypothetical protein
VLQLYVMVPGNPTPQLMTLEDCVGRIRKGELPRTANVVRVGEATWTKAEELSEIKALIDAPPGATPPPAPAHPSLAGAPPLPPVEAVPTVVGAPSTQLTSGQLPTAATPVAKIKQRVNRLPKGVIFGAAGALVVLVIGIVVLTIYRNSYSHGVVFDHLPEDCAELVYVDVEGISGSDPVKPNIEKGLKNGRDVLEDSVHSHKDKERIDDVLDALKKNGVDIGTVREAAVCLRANEEKKIGSFEEDGLLILGGTFRKGDPLQAISDVLEAATGKDDICKIEDDDFKILKCNVDLGYSGKRTPFYAALLEGRVLGISGDKKLLKSVKNPKNVAKAYGATKGEHVIVHTAKEGMSWDGVYGDIKLKVGATDTVLVIEEYFDADKGKNHLTDLKDPDGFVSKKEDAFKSAAKTCFTGSDFDMLADTVDGAKIEVYEDGLKYELKAANKDLARAMKEIADADEKDIDALSRLGNCIIRTVESSSPAVPPPLGYE